MWSPQGFHVVNSLREDMAMSSTYFIDNILTETAAVSFPEWRTEQSSIVILCIDNCSAQRSRMTKGLIEQNGMKSMPHPSYSPNLVSSDFFLFPLVKKRLDRFECEYPDDLLEALIEILDSRQTDRLQHVFQRWIDRIGIVSGKITATYLIR
jgi:hypothetical protein